MGAWEEATADELRQSRNREVGFLLFSVASLVPNLSNTSKASCQSILEE